MGARILVVEDDRDALSMLLLTLQLWGYQADGATSGAIALERMRTNCPDVVISDLVMPGMSGLELLQAIRAQKDCQVAFFLITGNGSVEVAVNAICEGADEILLKPFQPETLIDKLTRRGFHGDAHGG
jgi:DNA-binding response OmpR family regulator